MVMVMVMVGNGDGDGDGLKPTCVDKVLVSQAWVVDVMDRR